MTIPAYELCAIKYAHHARLRSANFIGGDPHDGPMPMDYFVWLARSAERTFVIDTGFNAEAAARRKRDLMRCPTKGLAMLEVDAAKVQDVIITHLHYDHVGNFDLFPGATFLLQDREMQFATGRHMCARFSSRRFRLPSLGAPRRPARLESTPFRPREDPRIEARPYIPVERGDATSARRDSARIPARVRWGSVSGARRRLSTSAGRHNARLRDGRARTAAGRRGARLEGFEREDTSVAGPHPNAIT